MLTFIRGESTFFGPGQIYVKLLPDGEPVRLTNDTFDKMSPKFSPDGARIGYRRGSILRQSQPRVLIGRQRWTRGSCPCLVGSRAGSGQRRGTDLDGECSRSAQGPVF